MAAIVIFNEMTCFYLLACVETKNLYALDTHRKLGHGELSSLFPPPHKCIYTKEYKSVIIGPKKESPIA